MRPKIVVDLESTGLNPFLHEAYEVAWADLDGGEIHSTLLPHTLQNADPVSLKIGGYWERGFRPTQYQSGAIHVLRLALVDATLVGANPAFDSGFLVKALGVQVWHHRLLDVEQMAQWIFAWDEPKGLREISDWLVELGHEIPEPDHTARGDVATTRACYHALRSHA